MPATWKKLNQKKNRKIRQKWYFWDFFLFLSTSKVQHVERYTTKRTKPGSTVGYLFSSNWTKLTLDKWSKVNKISIPTDVNLFQNASIRNLTVNLNDHKLTTAILNSPHGFDSCVKLFSKHPLFIRPFVFRPSFLEFLTRFSNVL